MAWLYLLFIILVFHTPIVGLGSALLQRDFEITISGLRLSVPFTGSLRWLLYSLLAWWLIWSITRWVEKRTGSDIFYWLDQQVPFLRLRERWIYATRPSFSIRLAVRLAELGLVIALAKLVGVLLLGVLVALTVPQLLQTTLPGLIEYLLVHFSEAGWVETVIGWISGPLREWLAGAVIDGLRNALDDLLGFDLPAHLLAISVLVLSAHRAYQQERKERYQLDVKRVQQERKRTQADIKVFHSL